MEATKTHDTQDTSTEGPTLYRLEEVTGPVDTLPGGFYVVMTPAKDPVLVDFVETIVFDVAGPSRPRAFGAALGRMAGRNVTGYCRVIPVEGGDE